MVEFSGRCACGEVTWTAKGAPLRNLVCHCEDCRRALSGPVMVSMGFPRAAVTWLGERSFYESTPGTFRDFCPSCGTRLTFRSDKWLEEVHIMAATLDDPTLYHPDAQVCVDDAVVWLDQIWQVPAHSGFQREPSS